MKTSFSRSIIFICFKVLIGRRDYLALVLHFIILYFINMIFFISHRNSQHKVAQKLHLAQTTALSPHHLHSIREASCASSSFLYHTSHLFSMALNIFLFFFFLIKVNVWKELKCLSFYDYLFGSLIYNVLYISLQNHFYITEEKSKKNYWNPYLKTKVWLCIEKEKMTFTGL